MTGAIRAFLDASLPPLFRERPAEIDPWFYDYFGELVEPAARQRYARAVAADLELAGVDPSGRVVLDAGSGFGITLLCLAALAPRLAAGLEAFRPMALTSVRLCARLGPGLPAAVVRGSVAAFPFARGSVDFIYCNEALSHFLDRNAFYDECARVLKPGGKLMICDGNNALNPGTVARVRQIWKRFEEGPPIDDLFGHRIERPYRDRRREMIDVALPELGETVLDRLAWGTFGRHGADILIEARRILASGQLPEAPPVVDRSPVDPVKGDHIESLVDAGELRAQLEPRGFLVQVHAHFGGARSPILAAVNQLLRAASFVTLPWARSVKIVATRV
ncbi:MAG: methyltransferase domain-containing protein [Candidatus Eisenbacteria bacterium]|nr:methyltransferase domain-containing protein [Candidatus Eisenbacteria bacterium]